MKYLRIVLIVVAVAGVLALGTGAFAIWFVSSDSATAWLMRSIEARSGGRLNFAGVSGALADEVTLTDLRVDTGYGVLRIDELSFDLDFAGLLARALVIDELRMGQFAFEDSGGTAVGPGAGADLPVLVLVRNVSIDAGSIRVAGRAIDVGATRFSVRYVDRMLDLEELSTSLAGYTLEGELGISRAARLDADFCVHGSFDREPIDACSRVSGVLPSLEVDGAATRPFAASYEGTVQIGRVPELDIGVTWTDAALSGFGDYASPAADLRLDGPIDRLRITGSGTARYRALPFEFSTNVLLAGSALTVDALDLTSGASEVNASGEVDLGMLSASLDIVASHVDPSLLASDWPGALDVRASLDVSAGAPVSIDLTDIVLGGQLRGYPLAATGGVSYGPAGWHLADVVITSRTDRAELSGSIAAEVELSVDAEVHDLGLLWPGLEGGLEADADIFGSRSAPRIRGSAIVSNLSYRDYAAERVMITGSGGSNAQELVSSTIEARSLRWGQLNADRLSANLSGTVERHTVDLSMAAGPWTLEGRADGGMIDERWSGALESLTIVTPSLGQWQLEESGRVSLGAGGVSVARSCIGQSESSLCVEADLFGSDEERLMLHASHVDLDLLAPLFPEGFTATGRYEIELALTGVSTDPQGSLSLSAVNTTIHYELSEREVIDYAFRDIAVDAALSQKRLSMNGRFASEPDGNATIEMSIDDVDDEDSAVSGHLSLRSSDTSLISLVSPEIGDVQGALFAQIDVGGSLSKPEIRGQAQWMDASVDVPVWGLTVTGIEASMESTDASDLRFMAMGLIGDSPIELQGRTQLDPSRNWPTELRVRGNALKLVQLQDAEVVVSPDLNVVAQFPSIEVRGSVDVPTARIAVVALPEQAISPSADIVVHGREAVEEIRPLDVHASIDVRLGSDVHYIGSNLDAVLSGQISLDYRSGRPTTASGSLNLGGQYDAYGNPLALERGQLIFAGPWNNPAVDVRATRSIGEITVGVQMSGTLQAPETRIYSQPAMSEAEALSYLLLGRPLVNAEGDEAVTLESAALSMGLRQAVPVIERIGETLGFDEFTVRATENDAGALMAGKYLSPKLYVRYTYGLFNRIGGLLLRYRISDRLSVETQSGDQKSMDLLYTVEKD